jgi:hypothetical protein
MYHVRSILFSSITTCNFGLSRHVFRAIRHLDSPYILKNSYASLKVFLKINFRAGCYFRTIQSHFQCLCCPFLNFHARNVGDAKASLLLCSLEGTASLLLCPMEETASLLFCSIEIRKHSDSATLLSRRNSVSVALLTRRDIISVALPTGWHATRTADYFC